MEPFQVNQVNICILSVWLVLADLFLQKIKSKKIKPNAQTRSCTSFLPAVETVTICCLILPSKHPATKGSLSILMSTTVAKGTCIDFQ